MSREAGKKATEGARSESASTGITSYCGCINIEGEGEGEGEGAGVRRYSASVQSVSVMGTILSHQVMLVLLVIRWLFVGYCWLLFIVAATRTITS